MATSETSETINPIMLVGIKWGFIGITNHKTAAIQIPSAIFAEEGKVTELNTGAETKSPIILARINKKTTN